MIVTADALAAIKQRKKSEIRWPVRILDQGEPRERLERDCPFADGHVYKAQTKRGQPGHEITIIATGMATLGDIGQSDLVREGYRFLADFKRDWQVLHGPYENDRPVWVLTIAFGDVRDMLDNPRLLSARPGRSEFRPGQDGRSEVIAHGGDYTTDPMLAMRGEPEAIPAPLTEQYTKEGHENYRLGAAAGVHGSIARITEEIELLRQHVSNDSPAYNRKVLKAIRDLDFQRAKLVDALDPAA